MASLGLNPEQLLIVSTQASGKASNSLWALEQALKSGHVGAIVAWLPPRLRAESVRRLQLASHNHDGVAFVIRDALVQDRPSAAPLRLALSAAGADRLRVHVVKRRGPPLLEPVTLALLPALSAAARRRSQSSRYEASSQALPTASFAP
jgi:protein ImuA